MNAVTFSAKVDAAIEAGACSKLGQLILERYRAGIEFPDNRFKAYMELRRLRRLCELLAQVPIDEISVDSLLAASELVSGTKTARLHRLQAVRRVIRLFQEDGLLPCVLDLRLSRKLKQLLAGLPAERAAPLQSWLAYRFESGVGWHELLYEARRLAILEEIASQQAREHSHHDGDTVTSWLWRTLQPIVDCPCHPVTRARDPDRCSRSRCGATPETHGHRPSRGAKRHGHFEVIGHRYLRHRRAVLAGQLR